MEHQVYDRVWDFGVTTMLVHLILSAAISGGLSKGAWWGCFIGGGVLFSFLGYFVSHWHYGRQLQARLDGKVNALN